jgi:hypothetical protein
MREQRKWTDKEGFHLVDRGGNHFIRSYYKDEEGQIKAYWKCINSKVTDLEAEEVEIPEYATQSGVVKTGRITQTISTKDGFGREIIIEP